MVHAEAAGTEIVVNSRGVPPVSAAPPWPPDSPLRRWTKNADFGVGIKLGRDKNGGYWLLDMVRAARTTGNHYGIYNLPDVRTEGSVLNTPDPLGLGTRRSSMMPMSF